jgi:hypothetical protein
MMTSHSLICLLENQNGGKLQKYIFSIYFRVKSRNKSAFNISHLLNIWITVKLGEYSVITF